MQTEHSKNTYRFITQVFRQGASPRDILSFTATAADLFRFGGVPAKTERFHGGFQRALSNRYKKIIRFFDDDQISPTSIVLAFREGAAKFSSLPFPGNWPDSDKLNATPTFALLEFESLDLDPENTPLSTLVAEANKILLPRIKSDPASNGESDLELLENEEPDANGDESDDAEDDDDATLDVGQSKLRAFHSFINDDERLKAWLSEQNEKYELLRKKKNPRQEERDFVEFTPEQRIKHTLISLLRPAMIVDGQHRVMGAYNSVKSPIFFNVCAITEADWVEQVFQFIVLNKLAKPISKSFLSGLLNTALTNNEIHDIEARLEQVSIKNTDRILLRHIEFSKESPFFGMIAQAGEVVGVDNTGKLSDKGMIRLARTWYTLRNANNKARFRLFQHTLRVKTQSKAVTVWPNKWHEYFYAFWGEIRKLYEPEKIWEKSENLHLLKIVTLNVLQESFLSVKQQNGVPFTNMKDFRKQVHDFFEPVPATFFQGWKKTGLQSGDGPGTIERAIADLRAGKKLSEVHSDSPLFRSDKVR